MEKWELAQRYGNLSNTYAIWWEFFVQSIWINYGDLSKKGTFLEKSELVRDYPKLDKSVNSRKREAVHKRRRNFFGRFWYLPPPCPWPLTLIYISSTFQYDSASGLETSLPLKIFRRLLWMPPTAASFQRVNRLA